MQPAWHISQEMPAVTIINTIRTHPKDYIELVNKHEDYKRWILFLQA